MFFHPIYLFLLTDFQLQPYQYVTEQSFNITTCREHATKWKKRYLAEWKVLIYSWKEYTVKCRN